MLHIDANNLRDGNEVARLHLERFGNHRKCIPIHLSPIRLPVPVGLIGDIEAELVDSLHGFFDGVARLLASLYQPHGKPATV